MDTTLQNQNEKTARHRWNSGEWGLFCFSLFWSLAFLIATPLACLVSGEGWSVFANFYIILTSPSKLITDYFNLGSMGSTFLNAGLCGLCCNVAMLLTKPKMNGTVIAGYFLVIAHCFYGLNLVNMWPPFLGIVVFCLVRKIPVGDLVHFAMFATSLGPFVSDLLFRYTLGDTFDATSPRVTLFGVLLAILFGLGAGFLIPALLPGTSVMHRGHNLYKAGLAIGLFGMFAYALLYKTLGIPSPDTVVRDNPIYTDAGEGYIPFINGFYGVIFLACIVYGFVANGKTFLGYEKLWRCDGWQDDFEEKFGLPLTVMNVGIYGFFILAYYDLIFLLTPGVGFSGPSVGVVLAALTFACAGQTVRTVWPIAVGYAVLSLLTQGFCALEGLPAMWSLSTQAYINGFAFATGLCPFSGRYGWKTGVLAGMLHAVLCTSTVAMHGGFVLYNGGFTSGLTALLLLPILDFYHVKVKDVLPGE